MYFVLIDTIHFRNPQGVVLKVGNFKDIDPSKPSDGPGHTQEVDLNVWADFGDDPQRVEAIAQAIRRVKVCGGTECRIHRSLQREQPSKVIPGATRFQSQAHRRCGLAHFAMLQPNPNESIAFAIVYWNLQSQRKLFLHIRRLNQVDSDSVIDTMGHTNIPA